MNALLLSLSAGLYLWALIFKATGVLSLPWLLLLLPFWLPVLIFLTATALILALGLCAKYSVSFRRWIAL